MATTTNTAAKRAVLKLSGEALGGGAGRGIEPDALARIAAEVAAAAAASQLALVIGGGNLARGAALAKAGLDRVTADHVGMLATMMNALAFRDALLRQGVAAQVLSSPAVPAVTEGYSAHRARALLAAGRVVLLAGGTGNPLFTTDTAACLRGVELQADLVVKATQVDGVYDADPAADPHARRYDALDYGEALSKRLRVMDIAAIALCEEHDLPVVVCDIAAAGALTKALRGDKVGTRIAAGPTT